MCWYFVSLIVFSEDWIFEGNSTQLFTWRPCIQGRTQYGWDFQFVPGVHRLGICHKSHKWHLCQIFKNKHKKLSLKLNSGKSLLKTTAVEDWKKWDYSGVKDLTNSKSDHAGHYWYQGNYWDDFEDNYTETIEDWKENNPNLRLCFLDCFTTFFEPFIPLVFIT